MPTGAIEVDFGTGDSYASVDVTGQTGLVSNRIEAWAVAEDSSDGSRTIDEAVIDPTDAVTEFLDATSFRIHCNARDGIVAGKVPHGWATLP